MSPTEHHYIHRSGWLRAAVLGANDGIVSTASLVLGVAASGADTSAVLVAGVAALVAGALSMAAGEYVSVSSQADTERADLAKEQQALARHPQVEQQELAEIYQQRGLSPALAVMVARELMAHDPLAAHARDELGISETLSARPLQAALTSAACFSIGALLPLLAIGLLPDTQLMPGVMLATVLALGLLGALSARLGGAPIWRGSLRVLSWGILAMGLTALVGRAFGGLLA